MASHEIGAEVSPDVVLLPLLVEELESIAVVLAVSSLDEVVVDGVVDELEELPTAEDDELEVTSVVVALESAAIEAEGSTLAVFVDVAIDVASVIDGCVGVADVPEPLPEDVVELCASVPRSGDRVPAFSPAQAVTVLHNKPQTTDWAFRPSTLFMTMNTPFS